MNPVEDSLLPDRGKSAPKYIAEFLGGRLGGILGSIERYATRFARPVSDSWPAPEAGPCYGLNNPPDRLKWYVKQDRVEHPGWRYGGMAEVVLAGAGTRV